MDTKDKVVVQTHDGSQLAVVDALKFETVTMTWEKNGNYQLTFTAVNNGKLAYELLQNENYIWYREQQYVIKQTQMNLSGSQEEINVTATHIFYQTNFIRQDNIKEGKQLLTLTSALDWIMSNAHGYSYRIHGIDNQAKIISDLGNCTVMEGLNTLTSLFNIYCIYPDNKTIHLYSQKEWLKDTNRRISYRYNTESIQLDVSSTEFTNKIWVVSTHQNEERNKTIDALTKEIDNKAKQLDSKRKEHGKLIHQLADMRRNKKPLGNLPDVSKKQQETIAKASDELKTLRQRLASLKKAKKDDNSDPLFTPFYATNEQSMKTWGVAYAQRYETDSLNKEQATRKALATLKPDPSISITASKLVALDDVNPGDELMLQIPERKLLTKVEVVSITKQPFVKHSTSVTLNNKRQNFLNMQSARQSIIQSIKTNTQSNLNTTQYQFWDMGEISDG